MPNCPYCGKYFAKKQLTVDHINKLHGSRLEADGMDACQSLYFSTHHTLKGKCQCGCGKDTEWNYNTGKPYKVSPDPKCRERLRSIATQNMVKVYGKTTLLDDMEHQKMMQEHRHTAGEYTFSDGGKVEYLSSLEKNFLMFCDKIMDFTSNMVVDPPENFTYFDPKANKTRTYMPDYYLPDYNLLIEIKDGGEKSNTNPAFIEETKYKVYLKDEAMKRQTRYNYIRISGKNYSKFVEVLYAITHDLDDDASNKKRKNLVVITESACFDPSTDIDVTKLNPEDFRIMYLLCGHDAYHTHFVAVSTNEFCDSELYVTDYMNNILTKCTLAELVDMYPDDYIDKYKCIADPSSIGNILHDIITSISNDNIDNRWDILNDYLSSYGVSFTDIHTTNNTDKKMSFIHIQSYKASELGGEKQ